MLICSKLVMEVKLMSESNIYSGSSEGFSTLVNGYVDYAKEIIGNRSFPDYRDGLKPVSRKILYASSQHKKTFDNFVKSATLVGRAMEIHPHGDSSIYGTLCGMTDKKGIMNVPIFQGNGEFGTVESSDDPAQMRYTKVKFLDTVQDYIMDMDACEMVLSEEGDGYEPVVFPVRYPSVLVNGTSGMAVAVSNYTLHFNFLDILNLTQEYLKDGKCSTVIVPDFPTGGILVRDDKELMKIMLAGVGKIKVRAKVEIEGKDILVKEVPTGKSTESIVKAITRLDLDGVVKASNLTGNNTDTVVKIRCKSKKITEYVLMQLYKHRILQTSVTSNLVVTGDDREPIYDGVWGIIERWVKWRRGIVIKKYTQAVEGIEPELRQLDYFMQLVSNEEWKSTILDKLAYKSKAEGKEYLKEIFPDIPDEVCNWIIKRDVPAYNHGDRYAKRYEDLLHTKEIYEGYISNPDEYIYSDIEDVKRHRSAYFSRKTEVTYTDYKFSSKSDSEAEDYSECLYTVYSDGFITKTRDEYGIRDDADVLYSINGKANSELIGFDYYGRILRLFGNEIPFTARGDRGEYLPRYFGAEGYEGYKIAYLSLLDGKKRMLIYRDGFVGFLDTSEFVGKKRIRAIMNGVDTNVYDKLTEVVHEDDFKEYLVVAEDSGKKIRFGTAEISNIRVASRKSRAKVFGGDRVDIGYCATMGYIEMCQFMQDPFYFDRRMRALGNMKVFGDTEEIMKEGRFYGTEVR